MATHIMACLVDRRPDFSNAACIGAPSEIFFPDYNPNGIIPREVVAEARTFCNRCPVKAECLEFACRTDSVGIWGGQFLSEHITRKLRKRNGWTLQREVIPNS